MSVAQVAPDKNTKEELAQFAGMLKSLGYGAKRNPVTITITNPTLGDGEQSVFWRGDNTPAGIRLAMAALRAKIAPAKPDSQEDARQDSQPASDTPVVMSLASQRAELSANGSMPDVPIADVVSRFAPTYTVAGNTYTLADYPALRDARKHNPAWGKDIATFTSEETEYRRQTNVVNAWERKARNVARESGALASATPRGDSQPATDKPAKRASASASQPSPVMLSTARYASAIRVLSEFPDSATAGDILAVLSERHASAITIPYYGAGEHDVTSKAKLIATARDSASQTAKNIPDRVIAGAIEDAKDAERTISIVIVGTLWETTSAKPERVKERYASVPGAFLYATVSEDGTVTRLAIPQLLTIAPAKPASQPASASAGTIPTSLIASVTAIVDPASVPSQDAPAGITATETAKLDASQDSATIADAAK